jgi:hypothetical protein
VLVEHGGHGGSAAAPIARAIVDEFLKNEAEALPVPPSGPEPRQPDPQIEARVAREAVANARD